MDVNEVALAIYGHVIQADLQDDVGPGKPDDIANLAYAYAEAFLREKARRTPPAKVGPLPL